MYNAIKNWFAFLFLVITILLSACGTVSTQTSMMSDILNFSNSNSVHLKGSLGGITFELKDRIERGSDKILLRKLIRGSQSSDYFIEAVFDIKSRKIVQGVVTRAKVGSMSMYVGYLSGIANSVAPDDAQFWSFNQDLSDYQEHLLTFSSDISEPNLKLQLLR